MDFGPDRDETVPEPYGYVGGYSPGAVMSVSSGWQGSSKPMKSKSGASRNRRQNFAEVSSEIEEIRLMGHNNVLVIR
ncbi:hypothetical protein [Bradyrhizobium cytisi]|uniref:Uncharacterized protein n=1 Tax=Bradyrhizobium cytisi TaxID=515489 RepID=A0A5S4VZ43_9BRAD|nr:hypothetical protein [Bradyrhizobium cytisi]TYL72341.1 hypothetical protein FXB38_38720 [Bradyrhizobium cytisi]